MYLSRVRVATEGLDRRALLDLMAGNAYTNHQLLWRLFTGQPERKFLFRQETEQEQLSGGMDARGLPLFYVLSDEKPVDVPGLLQSESKPLNPALQDGDQLAFRLRANPTVAKKKAEGGRSVRHDVLMDAKQHCRENGISDARSVQAQMDAAARTWLSQRSEKAGFVLESEPQVTGYRQHAIQRKGNTIQFSSVDYEGILRVSEPELFTSMLQHGLGRSKAFGCGLMLVRRV